MITERDPSGDHVMDFGLCLFFREGCSTGAVLLHRSMKATGGVSTTGGQMYNVFLA